MTNDGWIKLHRKILENSFCQGNAERLGFWTTLLLLANHKGNTFYLGNQSVTCDAGQFATGRKSLASIAGVSEMKAERWLTCLETAQQIAQQKMNKYRLITVKNWKQYQMDEQQNAQQMNNRRTTDEQQMNTNKNDKNVKNVKKAICRASPDDVRIAQLLSDLIRENLPKSREPDVTRWAEDIEKLHRIDGLEYQEIEAVVRWCQSDHFWKANILSASKLREKRDTLIAHMKRNLMPKGTITSL